MIWHFSELNHCSPTSRKVLGLGENNTLKILFFDENIFDIDGVYNPQNDRVLKPMTTGYGSDDSDEIVVFWKSETKKSNKANRSELVEKIYREIQVFLIITRITCKFNHMAYLRYIFFCFFCQLSCVHSQAEILREHAFFVQSVTRAHVWALTH